MGQGLPDYGTHHPVLAAAVMMTKGPMLELGCGHYSTPILHQMSLVSGRKLYTVETDLEWMKLFTSMGSDLHKFVHKEDISQYQMEGYRWGVAFVDCAPGEYRKEAVARLAHHASLIVVHDTETDYNTGADYKYEQVFSTFKFRRDYCRYRPYTTVLSMFQDFPISECDKIWLPDTAENPTTR